MQQLWHSFKRKSVPGFLLCCQVYVFSFLLRSWLGDPGFWWWVLAVGCAAPVLREIIMALKGA